MLIRVYIRQLGKNSFEKNRTYSFSAPHKMDKESKSEKRNGCGINECIFKGLFRKSMKKMLLTHICLLFGAFLQGMSMSLFLFPHFIPSGGAAGLAILLNHWFELPLGFSLWLANIVFLLFALKYFGYTWTIRTIVSVATTSITISMLSSRVSLPHLNIFLDIVIGSVLFGIGVGILIRVGASSGGMVIPALMVAKYKKWSPGKVMMWINFSIFLLTALVINYQIVIYAVICQFFSTNIIDFIYEFRFPKPRTHAAVWRKK